MAIHRVLVEGNEEIEAVSHVGDGIGSGADGEKGMTTANDGLVGVVGVQMKATATENLGEDVAGGCHTLASCASDTYGERLPHTDHPSQSRDPRAQCLGTSDSSNEEGFYVVLEAAGKRDVICA